MRYLSDVWSNEFLDATVKKRGNYVRFQIFIAFGFLALTSTSEVRTEDLKENPRLYGRTLDQMIDSLDQTLRKEGFR